MAIRPTRGSGIGQVSPFSVLDRSQNASSLLGAGVNPQTNGIGQAAALINQNNQILPSDFNLTDLSPVPGSIGISQVPSTGLPNLDTAQSGVQRGVLGLDMTAIDDDPFSISTIDPSDNNVLGIITPKGQESFSEFTDILGSFYKPNPERRESIEAGRRARNRDQILSDAAEVESQADRDFANSILADAQRVGGQRTEEVLAAAEAQAAGGTGGTGGVGGTSGVGGDPRNEGPAAGGKPVAGTEDDPVKAATVTALDEYLKSARPGVSPEGYDQYIEEFQKATGLDVSGQPDKSTALMAFGLALMQNKAGKGFDVGAMLSSVGEAGEKALPELTAARKEARAIRAKAGEYALGRKKEDQAAAMNRTGYYIVPRGADQQSFIKNFDKGRLVRLNSYELNSLDKDTEFGQQYEILPMSVYESVAKEVFKTPEYGDKYASSYDNISLFTDAPDDLQISVQRVDANYKGPDRPGQGYFNPQEYDTYKARLDRMASGLNKTSQKLATAYSLVESGKVDAPGQIADAVVGFGNAFGLNLTDQATDRDKVIYILESIAAQEAPRILGEAGKTISDADRERVGRIVGRVKLTQDPNALALALKEVHDLIVVDGIKDVNMGITTLNQYAGISAPPQSQNQMPEGEDEEGAFFDATQ
jgi:hypothetical protein